MERRLLSRDAALSGGGVYVNGPLEDGGGVEGSGGSMDVGDGGTLEKWLPSGGSCW